MAQRELTAELHSLRTSAESRARSISQVSAQLSRTKRLLEQNVAEYAAKRIEFFKEVARGRDVAWCTECVRRTTHPSMISASTATLVLIEGREMYSGGYENSEYGFRNFSKLQRLCPDCYKRFSNLHGLRERHNLSLDKDETFLYVFRVEKRADGCYAHKFGNPVKLDERVHTLDEPPLHLIEEMADALGLPPRIELATEQFGLDRGLVVHERAVSKTA